MEVKVRPIYENLGDLRICPDAGGGEAAPQKTLNIREPSKKAGTTKKKWGEQNSRMDKQFFNLFKEYSITTDAKNSTKRGKIIQMVQMVAPQIWKSWKES